MKTKPAIFDTKPIRVFIKILDFILGFCGFALILLVTYYVATRYLFHKDFDGFEEIALLLAVYLYLLGSAKASYEQSHIAADMLSMFVKKESTMTLCRIIRRLISSAAMVILCYLSVDFVRFNLLYPNSTMQLHIPNPVYYISMTIGFVLMLFFDICYIADDVKTLRKLSKGTGTEGGTE